MATVITTAFSNARVACRPQARRTVAARAAADRAVWYPGAVPPSYLDGSLPGDYGFDPLRLGSGDALAWYVEGERTNGRWAMAATTGIIFTDAVGLPEWWEAGAQKYALDTPTLLAIELALFAILEAKRYEGWKKTGGAGVLSLFPFDPMGMASERMHLAEVLNGRLAMLSFVGYCSQYAVRGKSPLDCLNDHLSDPNHQNIFTSSVATEMTVAAVVLAIVPTVIETRKALAPEEEDDEFKPIPF